MTGSQRAPAWAFAPFRTCQDGLLENTASLSIFFTRPYDEQRHQKVVLAYSGGLDTSVILKWLIETYKCSHHRHYDLGGPKT